MTERTKGPWHVGACREHALDEAMALGLRCVAVRDEGGCIVPDTIENLRIKAAAPDLLEALEQAERKLKCGHEERADCVCFDCELLRTVRAAIAKAREGGR